MKTLGLIGGMSWQSSAEYYRLVNQEVQKRLGGQHSAKVLLYSVDFHEIESWQHLGQWERAGNEMAEAARRLAAGGAEAIVLCTNTMHKLAPQIESAVSLPFLHIADATGEALRRTGFQKAALLGTQFTMEESFYKDRLSEKFGLEIMIPEQKDRQLVHRIIYDELCLGEIKETSRKEYQRIVHSLSREGAQAAILGCTEIGLLLTPATPTPIPLFDTTVLHAHAAVDFALA